MNRKCIFVLLVLSGAFVICGQILGAEVKPPVAEKIPKKLEAHGHVRIDDYYWLKERDNPKVIAYLEAENDYTEAQTAHTASLQEKQ